MALREQGGATATPTRPAFEGEVIGRTVEPAVGEPSAVTAVAPAKGTAIVKSSGYGGNIYDAAFKQAIPPLEFGTVPRIVATQGQAQAKFDGKKVNLGTEIDLDLISFNDEFVVSPGEDSEEATSKVRYSYDNETIEGTGESVQAYLAKLRDQDQYPNAAVKQYVQLIGVLVKINSKDAVAQKLVGKMVQVSLAPQSAKSFTGFTVQKSVAYHTVVKKTGTAPSTEGMDLITITAEGRSGKGSKEYTGFSIEDRKAA